MDRRAFAKDLIFTASALVIFPFKKSIESTGFYQIAQRKGRWWLIRPDGHISFSLGLNHIDPASLRYPENRHIREEKYGNSIERWLKESVRPHLLNWGFNCLGWNQEVISRGLTNHRIRSILPMRNISGSICPISTNYRLPTFINGRQKQEILISIHQGLQSGVIL